MFFYLLTFRSICLLVAPGMMSSNLSPIHASMRPPIHVPSNLSPIHASMRLSIHVSFNLSPIHASMRPLIHVTSNPCVLQSVSDPCFHATSNPCVLQSVSDPCFHVSSCLLLMSPRVSIQCFHVYPSNVSYCFLPMSPRVSFQCLLPISPRVFFQRLCISPSNISFKCLPMSPHISFQSICVFSSTGLLIMSPRISFKCFSFEIYPGMMFNTLSPLTMLRYYFHYLPLLLPPQCFQMDLCVSFQYFLSMSSNVSPVPYLLPKYLLVFFHGSLSNVFSYLLQMFFL